MVDILMVVEDLDLDLLMEVEQSQPGRQNTRSTSDTIQPKIVISEDTRRQVSLNEVHGYIIEIFTTAEDSEELNNLLQVKYPSLR